MEKAPHVPPPTVQPTVQGAATPGPPPRRTDRARILAAMILILVGAISFVFLPILGIAALTAALILLVKGPLRPTSPRGPAETFSRPLGTTPLPTTPRRRIGLWIVLGGALLLQVSIELVLDLRGFRFLPGLDNGIPGTRLLEILIVELWFPILFLAAIAGFGLRRGIPAWIRFAVLGLYAGAMITLVPFAAGGSQAAEDTFFLLMLLVPIPALFFLFANGRHQWTLLRCAGFALIFAMLWRSVYFSFPDLLVIASGGAVSPPAATSALYRQFFLSVLWDFVYPIVGLMFFLHRVPGMHVPLRWGQNLEGLLRPFGAWVRRSWAADIAWGGALFVVDLIAAILLATLLESSPTGDVGDDSAVFNLITLDQVFIIAIIAGVGEELLFRGILQSGLHRLLGSGFVASSVAILVQAVAFAIVHSGYADLNHIIVPFAFGIFVGYVFRYFGIIPAIMIHVQVDIFAFGASYWSVRDGTTEGAIMGGTLALIFIANFAYATVYFFLRMLTWWEGRRKALAVLIRS